MLSVIFGRVALKAFTEQKRRYFPSLEVTTSENGPKAGTKRSRTEGSESTDTSVSSLPDILRRVQSEAPGMTVTPYVRLAWTSKFGSQGGAISGPVNKMLSKYASLQLKNSAGTAQPAVVDSPAPSKHVEKVAVLEVSIPEVLVAVISVLPAGSIYPDAVAIFSPAEVGHLFMSFHFNCSSLIGGTKMLRASSFFLYGWASDNQFILPIFTCSFSNNTYVSTCGAYGHISFLATTVIPL